MVREIDYKKLKKMYMKETGYSNVTKETIEECYMGSFPSIEDFIYELSVRYEQPIADWLVIDPDETWNRNLCVEFFYCEDGDLLHFFKY